MGQPYMAANGERTAAPVLPRGPRPPRNSPCEGNEKKQKTHKEVPCGGGKNHLYCVYLQYD